ncbi:tetratricopeptide repeat protein [Paenibacillus sp. GCM10028914]|uniref:tetratricopeptide repeat protein n=1 Tax=Paenibacillus sp. GCM10028914 TaxID=3273416 RepID=UPI00361D9CE9
MTITTNELAIEALENNDYDSSLHLFKQAVEESRNIQSLNNLAFLYISEGIRNEDRSWASGDLAAIELLRECISLNPISPFPYSLLGEAYLNLGRWQEATTVLEKAITFESPSPIAYHNLATAAYGLHDIEKAALYYSKAAETETDEYAKYAYAKCLIELNQIDEAGQVLDELINETEDYIGDVEIAELYLEMKQYENAVVFFEKGWDQYAKEPVWVDRFLYSLLQTGQHHKAEKFVQEVVNDNLKLIEEIHEDTGDDENWTLADRHERILEIHTENDHFRTLVGRLATGYVPSMYFQTAILSDCYWFGCARHGHPEYGR